MKKAFLYGLAAAFLLLSPAVLQAAPPPDTLVIAQGVDPSTLDPQDHYESTAFNVLLNMYETLFLRDDQMKLQPLLATYSKIVDDTTWEFGLRRGVTFHNGEPFNAAAVKFSLERFSDPKSKLKQTTLQGIIRTVEVVDDFTVRVITAKPYPYLDAQLGHIGAIMAPRHTQEKGKDISAHPVGTGPYRFVRWVRDDHLVMEANEKYWGGVPRIKRVIFRPIPEATTRVAGLQTQEVDLIVNIPPHLSKLMDWKGRSRVAKVPGTRVIFLAFDNTQGGPVADRRVRQAIAQSIDMDKIIKKILDGNGIKLGIPLTKNHFGYDPNIPPYAYDPEKAKKALAESGYAQGFDLTLNSPSGRYLNDREVAEAVAGDLRKVGLNAAVKVHEWGTYMTMLYAHKGGPSFLLGAGGVTLDADGTLFINFRSGQVYSHYQNPQFDALLDEARATLDSRKRQKLYSQALQIYRDEVICAFCYQQVDIYGMSERLNWKPRSDEKLIAFNMSFQK